MFLENEAYTLEALVELMMGWRLLVKLQVQCNALKEKEKKIAKKRIKKEGQTWKILLGE